MRPASASQHNYRLAPSHQQDMVRRHAVFGQDTPTQNLHAMLDGGAHASEESAHRDQLFVRPDAYRTLKGAAPRVGSGMSGQRSRPQSANAAVRHINARPVSGVARPGSARPRSSYAERLMHADADA